jgi:quercetin dioxygenase-like cupin family protein
MSSDMADHNDNRIIHEKLSPGTERTVAWLENIMVVVFDYKDGPMEHPEPPHSHTHEQISYVAEGELIFFKGNEEYHLYKGDLITVPSEIKHCIRTVSRYVRLIDSFSPVRKDFLKTSRADNEFINTIQ